MSSLTCAFKIIGLKEVYLYKQATGWLPVYSNSFASSKELVHLSILLLSNSMFRMMRKGTFEIYTVTRALPEQLYS